MYYNLKENEVRQIERIEEGYMRRVFDTTRGCPITQLYFELGQIPARFEVQKMRLLYLKYILEQPEESLLKKFLLLQFEKPSRGDWASTCLEDLKELDISLSLEEIKKMTKYKFSNILKVRISKNALNYLRTKQGKKGKEIEHESLEMSEYLTPRNNNLTKTQKQEMFAVRNRMIEIGNNFPKPNEEYLCILCSEKENMEHIYNCEMLNNKKKQSVKYENIFNGKMETQIEVFMKFKQNMENRKKVLSETYPHEILLGSTDCSNVISNG
jgi:hypothetical protein